jgi:heme A synthase
MFSIPQPPDWNALHVLVVHFPIALLMLAAPVLIGLALIIPKHSRQFAAAAAVMLLLGTGTCYLALNTGDAAEELAVAQGAESDPDIAKALHEHKEMAEAVTRYFTIFTAAFVLFLIVTSLRKEALPAAANVALLLLFLCGNALLALGLANAAHHGGLLVHEHGLLAPLSPGAGKAALDASLGSDETGDYSEIDPSDDEDRSTAD